MKIAICDDEKKCRETIAEYIAPYVQENGIVCEEFEDSEALLSHCGGKGPFDVIFLDIEMGGLNGVDAARMLRESGDTSILIFVTNHWSFISDSLRVGAFQFLVKPIMKQDFDKDFGRALEQLRLSRHFYAVKHGDKTYKFEVRDIIYIEGYDRRLSVHTREGKTDYTMKKLDEEEEKLSPYHFVRCHQGFLVNMDYIRVIQKDSVLLKTGNKIPVSKHRKTHVKSKFNNYLRRFSV